MNARVISVNVGVVREIEWHGEVVRTGIWKYPAMGRVAIRGVNLEGDEQADLAVHGGQDKAVYAYASEDYNYWRDVEQMQTSAGLFGENITTEGIDLSSLVVGTTLRIGTALLEASQPRLPCYKLGIRVDDRTFLKRFQQALRPGAYLRVIEEGDIGKDDEVEVVQVAAHGVTLRAMVEAFGDPAKTSALRTVDRLPTFWRRVAERMTG